MWGPGRPHVGRHDRLPDGRKRVFDQEGDLVRSEWPVGTYVRRLRR